MPALIGSFLFLQELKCAEAELFSQKKELDSLRIKASRTAELQNQVYSPRKSVHVTNNLEKHKTKTKTSLFPDDECLCSFEYVCYRLAD